MNVHCVNCRALRMMARVRAGNASPFFQCNVHGDIKTHLMPGDPPVCLSPKDTEMVESSILNPEVQHVPG